MGNRRKTMSLLWSSAFGYILHPTYMPLPWSCLLCATVPPKRSRNQKSPVEVFDGRCVGYSDSLTLLAVVTNLLRATRVRCDNFNMKSRRPILLVFGFTLAALTSRVMAQAPAA